MAEIEKTEETIEETLEETIADAIQTIRHFVKEISGTEPSWGEIARALKRYFVLREINDHILAERENPEGQT